MSSAGVIFLLITAFAVFTLPRKWAILPLLVGVCYMPLGQGVQAGPFNLTVIRMLMCIGFLRIIVRSERISAGVNSIDRIMLMFGIVAVLSSFFHSDLQEAIVFRFGLVLNTLGTYFLIRTFLANRNDTVDVVAATAFLLLPIAVEMLLERSTGYNTFSLLGGVSETLSMRDGKLRAQGPFQHAILAGTVGAVCLPLMIGIWRKHPLSARLGFIACIIMVLTSNSSGPILSAIFAALAIGFWRWRHLMGQLRIAVVVGYIVLELLMKVPAYYIIGRVDLTGSSTGWHRAALIESSIAHLSEWWLAGTDYTRHWMPTGVSWSPDHTDITNQYLQYGVLGGLPLMSLFILALVFGFFRISFVLRLSSALTDSDRFFVWTVGAALLTHAVTGISVSYFDQSFLFLYMTLAMIGTLHVMQGNSTAEVLTEGAETARAPGSAFKKYP